MPIKFDRNRWDAVRENADRWWRGELKRPLIHLTLTGCNPGRPEPDLPRRPRTAFYEGASAEAIIDRWDYDLSGARFLGDAFPARHPDFGPGVAAAFMGAETIVDTGTVWFRHEADTPLSDLELRLDLAHPWVRRIEDIYRAGLDRWQGGVQMGATDLGGALDILSTFRPGEKLPLDLYDAPGDVRAQVDRLHELWWTAFEHFNAVLQPVNPGYTAWTQLYSVEPYYMLQCDFSYMIGPGMFANFALPELTRSSDRLANAFYHLDGPGQLPHLDALLAVDSLKGIQWVPGAGSPGATHWIDIYRRIRGAGKLAQVVGDMADFDTVVNRLGSAEGLCLFASVPADRATEAEAFLLRHGVPLTP